MRLDRDTAIVTTVALSDEEAHMDVVKSKEPIFIVTWALRPVGIHARQSPRYDEDIKYVRMMDVFVVWSVHTPLDSPCPGVTAKCR